VIKETEAQCPEKGQEETKELACSKQTRQCSP